MVAERGTTHAPEWGKRRCPGRFKGPAASRQSSTLVSRADRSVEARASEWTIIDNAGGNLRAAKNAPLSARGKDTAYPTLQSPMRLSITACHWTCWLRHLAHVRVVARHPQRHGESANTRTLEKARCVYNYGDTRREMWRDVDTRYMYPIRAYLLFDFSRFKFSLLTLFPTWSLLVFSLVDGVGLSPRRSVFTFSRDLFTKRSRSTIRSNWLLACPDRRRA